MRDKTIKTMSIAAVLCLVAISVMSCKKRASTANTEAPEPTTINSGRDKKNHAKPDSTMLALEGAKLSSEEIQNLEEILQANPEDLVARAKVLGWYWRNQFLSESARKARHKHILWLIQNHADEKIAGIPEAGLNPEQDEEVYDEAKKLWIEQTETQKTNTTILGNAAAFFLLHDREITQELLKKAQALEPENPEWPERLGLLYRLDLIRDTSESKIDTAALALEQLEKALAATNSERDRFDKLADIAKMAYEADELTKAENYARELLAHSTRYKDDWNYGNAIHHGNLILGRIALKSGDLGKAKQYLIKAGKTPGSPQINYFGPNMALAKELLEKNEREIVIQYFELCSNFWKMGQDDLKKWANITRKGNIPDFRANLDY